MAPVRYGIIGTGSMGFEHIGNINALDGGEIVAVADPDEGQRAAGAQAAGGVAAFASHDELLASGLCDAVVIAAPNFRHHELLLDAIEAGVHILVEKPLCMTTSQCLDVAAAAETTDAVVWVGLEYRFMPPISALLTELAAGVTGGVKMVAIREHRLPFLQKVGDWNRFKRNTGGTLVEKCCHFFDLMNLVTGAEPTRVMASGAQDVNHLDEAYGGEVPDIMDNAFVIVDYDNGARGMLDLCMFADGSKYEHEISVVGPTGKAEALIPSWSRDQPGKVRLSPRYGGEVEERTIVDESIPFLGHHHGSSYLEHVAFVAAIRNGGAPAVTVNDGTRAVAIAEAAQLSIEEGRLVDLEEVLSRA